MSHHRHGASLPAGRFRDWLQGRVDMYGREIVRRTLSISGDQLDDYLARTDEDRVLLKTVDKHLTRWDGADCLATLYPLDDELDDAEQLALEVAA